MTALTCRLCHAPLRGAPFLTLERMPASAQGFPHKNELHAEKSVQLEVFSCTGCGLVQAQCEPVPYWREVIRANAFSPAMKAFRETFFADFVRENDLTGKSLVEVGCGRGECLDLFKAAGMQTFGTEYSTDNAAHARMSGHHIETCFPDNPAARLAGGPFDAFASFNFLEHWPDPRAVLETIHANTSEDAVGLIEVPNCDMILSRALFSEFIGDHLSYFTKQTLTSLLNISGFEVISCQSLWNDYILSAKVKKHKAIEGVPFLALRKRLAGKFESFFSACGARRICAWGAGHQALAVISLLKLERKIEFILDSAPFKQGLYTPATHLPIHAPNFLHDAGAGAVIIMAAGYSDEILKILKRDFNPDLKIAILRETELEILP